MRAFYLAQVGKSERQLIQVNLSKRLKRDQYFLLFILVHSPFAKKKKTPHSLELVVPFSAHYVAKQEPKLQYKGGFCS